MIELSGEIGRQIIINNGIISHPLQRGYSRIFGWRSFFVDGFHVDHESTVLREIYGLLRYDHFSIEACVEVDHQVHLL